VADFLARFSARALGPWRSALYGQIPGLLLFLAWLACDGTTRHKAYAAPYPYWLLALVAGTGSTLSSYAMTRGLIAGALSLVVPVVASYGAVSTVLAILTGERLSAMAALGIAITVGGIAAAAIGRRATRVAGVLPATHPRAGVGWALIAAGGYGATLWLQGRFVMPHLGPVMPLFLASLISLCVTVVLARMRGHSLAPPPRGVLRFTWGYGTLTAMAYLSLALGLATGQVAIVAVLSSLCSTITALMGFLLLKERLAVRQWAGICLILLGVGLINGG
jgi:drug/metabolite transporter (DMT)-like permease